MITVEFDSLDDLRSNDLIRSRLFDSDGKLLPLFQFGDEPTPVEYETWAKYIKDLYHLRLRNNEWVPELVGVVAGFPKSEVVDRVKLLAPQCFGITVGGCTEQQHLNKEIL